MDRPRRLCPFLDCRDARCAGLLTLTNLCAAFRLCAGDHELCTVYHQIRTDDLPGQPERLVARSA